MEETDTGGTGPVDLRCAEQAELLSLIISGDEEATREDSDLEDGEHLANGHVDKNSEAALTTAGKSPSTSYWSITEGPDHPLLLTISPGKARAPRGSRQTISRIPGRDHRRYYHEYWRSEYLMDFDTQRQSMVCMVCGSSLATLKLSTIKRHIRQKHPDSLLWSIADKEVIRSGWDSHLNVAGGQAFSSEETTAPEELMSPQPATVEEDGVTPQDCSQELSLQCPDPSPCPEEEDQPEQQQQDTDDPLAQTLERYLNNSLHAWFRQEFLMKYDGEAGQLQCMVCGAELPSLHLEHIKRHMLDIHPNSLVFSAEEKHGILQAWAQTHEQLENSIISEKNTKESAEDLFAQDEKTLLVKPDLHQLEDGGLAQDTCLIGEDGVIGAPQKPPQKSPPKAPRKRGRKPRKGRLRGGNPWRLRLDYLVAYGPQGKGTYCMVCSEILHETKVSSFRRHIQEAHPETTTLSREEREAMAAAWTKDYSADGQEGEEAEIIQGTADVLDPDGTNEDSSPDGPTAGKRLKEEEDVNEGSGNVVPPRQTHYPGKDQRRNYQSRWRADFLMDYDCRRHGLICMVCGATLATLKVSTIKRHIQQVHPHSLVYSPEEQQQALDTYSQSALHFRNTEDCISLDHVYSDPQNFGT
ncbi:zinc finger translocation-associated protein isoform X2 [Eucyclogobius newberryi]|uniref:zinc finger translocation-associated protein isoform X2 n=1 Tax=Eucyclogobius newberryi TaxID=166745 RepID=UPI003B5BED6C